jgi:putative ABC transport system substrate-binding protein
MPAIAPLWPQRFARRRRALAALVAVVAAAPWLVRGQAPARKYRIGFLVPTSADAPGTKLLPQLLEGLGYVPGRNAEFEQRFANGQPERLPALAAELVAGQVDIIIATAPPAIRAAQEATRTIPIVMAFSGDDPVASGFAQSLSRPGGNITGMTTIAHDFAPKWVELLHEVSPSSRRFAVLRFAGGYAHDDQIDAMRAVATPNNIALEMMEVRHAGEYAEAFAEMTRGRADALVIMSSPEFNQNGKRLADLALAHRLPSIFQFREFVVAGGLMSYGPDIPDLMARAAMYADRILRGANPAEMPIQQPTKFVLAINARTAAALRLEVPKSLLLRADEVVGS